jgi:hypothetical protein
MLPRIDVPHANDLAKCLSTHRSRIHPQRAAYLSRNPLEPLESPDLRIASGIGEFFLLNAHTGNDLAVADLDPLELATREMGYDTANSGVTYEKI